MSAIKLSAKKVKDVSNLKKIAEAWRECAINRGWVIDGENGKSITRFVEQLAGRDKTNISDIVLGDPNVYISPDDKYASKVRTEAICYFVNGTLCYIGGNQFWLYPITNFMTNNNYLISYCLALNLPTNIPLDTTPLGFTRGLRIDGKWDKDCGLYGSKGGYVVYCDGHVTWFDGDKPARFLKWDRSGYTSDVRETIPNTASFACGNDKTNSNYKSDGQLVILYNAGTGGN
jgi:prepilin-type processing-associated H-X9-DG protein